MIKYFQDTKLLSPELAKNLLSWKHSGLSIDNSIRVVASDNKAREAIAQYIAKCPVSLNKIIYEPFKGKVLFKIKYNNYFKENLKVSDILSADADEFIARIAQHTCIEPVEIYHFRESG